MQKLIAALALLASLVFVASASADGWTSTVTATNTPVSPPITGGGYPDPPGSNIPTPGTCGTQQLNSNHSESWLSVKPGTDTLVGASKFFVSKYSTFYNFYLGSYTINDGALVGSNQVQGYECTTVGTQEMPPSWTNSTDPNVDWDTKGRVYQTMLPFNAFWSGGLHPNAAIDVSYSDDNGANWLKGNGGADLEQSPNQNSVTYGHVEDKQWIAVNHIVGNVNQDHVYAMWTVFNGSGPSKIKVAISRNRGQTFSKAVTITKPSSTSPSNTYIYPSIGSDGTVYIAFIGGYDTNNKNRVGSVYVSSSKDDGVTWAPFVNAASPVENPIGYFQNTRFRDGIIENFAASPAYPNHVYLTYESWDAAAGTMDVYFKQSTDGGLTWPTPAQLVNDDANTAATDQFQPSVAAGSGGAVAVAFYDRRATCPTDSTVLAAERGDTNTCIDVSVQAYKDSNTAVGAQPIGSNIRVSEDSWDPEQPGQTLGGLSQYPCAGHTDPCPTGRGFIGDYFGLAISNGSIYTLSASTHYPSGIRNEEDSPIYYQQQVLGTLSRAALGL